MRKQTSLINLKSQVSHCADIISTSLDDEVVVMSIDHGNYYSMDTTGSYIWQLMETPLKIDTLCTQILQHFDVSGEQCENDLLAFVHELEKEGLISVTSP